MSMSEFSFSEKKKGINQLKLFIFPLAVENVCNVTHPRQHLVLSVF